MLRSLLAHFLRLCVCCSLGLFQRVESLRRRLIVLNEVDVASHHRLIDHSRINDTLYQKIAEFQELRFLFLRREWFLLGHGRSHLF